MRCQQIQDMFSASLDGELSPSKEALLKTHLVSCAACRARWEELQSTVELVRGLPELSPPSEFRVQVRQRLALLPAPANVLLPARTGFLSRLGWRHGFISAAAALILVLGTASLLWSGDLPGRLANRHDQLKQNAQLADVNQNSSVPAKTVKTGQPAAGPQRGQFGSGGHDISAGMVNAQTPDGSFRMESNNVAAVQKQVYKTASAPAVKKGNDKKTALMALPAQSPAHFSGSDLSSRGAEPAGTRNTPEGAGATAPARDTDPVGTGCGNAGGQTGTTALSDTAGLSRPVKTVRQASITLSAGDREGAKKEINLLAQRYNGMFNPDPDGSTFTAVLPVDSLKPFIAGLKDLGQTAGEKIEARDVSREYYNAVDQLSVLQNELTGQQTPGTGSGQKAGDAQTAGASSQQLAGDTQAAGAESQQLAGGAQATGVANQQLQAEINCLKGKIQSLEDAVSRATVKITLK